MGYIKRFKINKIKLREKISNQTGNLKMIGKINMPIGELVKFNEGC